MKRVAERRLAGLTIVLDGIHDPHNISAVLRSCDGFGIQHVHLIGIASELSANRQITRGCHKWLTLHHHTSAAACAETLHADGFALWAALPDREQKTLDDIDFCGKVALLFGAERDGLSDELIAQADGKYVIPMPGFSQSLNVSVAAAISLYVGSHARRHALGQATDMTHAETEALAKIWINADNERKRRGCPDPD